MASELHPLRFELQIWLGGHPNTQSFIFGDSNWKFCTLKPDIQMQTFLTWDIFFLCFYFWVKKIKTCWIYKNTVFANWEKYEGTETFVWCLLLIFKVVYRDHLTQLLPFAWDFIAKGQRLVLSGLSNKIKYCDPNRIEYFQIQYRQKRPQISNLNFCSHS